MNNQNLFANVIVPLSLRGTFTYSIPDKMKELLIPGMRVLVQFGPRKIITAIIKEIHNNKPEDFEIKPIYEIIDSEPIVNRWQLELWDWITFYYMCSVGEVYKAALPAGLKLESEIKVLFRSGFEDFESLTENEKIILENLNKENNLSLTEIKKLLNVKQSVTIVKRLIEKEAIIVEENVRKNYKPKTEKYIRLNSKYTTEEELSKVFDSLKRATKQLKILISYLDLSKYISESKIKEVTKKVLLEKSGSNQAALKSLKDKGYFEEYTRVVERLDTGNIDKASFSELNKEQENALKEIKLSFTKKETVLLHGITSSGKTEVYIRLMADALKQNKQVLYLLPEIALTTQIINRLKAVFGNDIGIYHSKFSDAERVEIWQRLQNYNHKNPYKIILGVRSSIFLPFSNLGLIIVDEEHENTYKQYSPAPRYNARDVATILAKMHGAKTLLGSATPSLESYFNTQNSKYGLVNLFSRYKNIEMPEIIIADMATARRKKKMKSLFTPELLENISEALEKKEQIILFQNRRGYSPYLECSLCGWVPKCKNCDVSLTYHKRNNSLICHYCSHAQHIISECPACGNTNISTRGFGTERVEDEISIFYPDAKVLRMDVDSTRSKHGYENIISAFERGEVDILIGTQMVTKGLDFDNVSVVGILNADNMLNFPDFRAFERSFQLMTQVSGRAGRKNKRGKVVIQVTNPKHEIVLDVLNNDFTNMYNSQLEERIAFKYPPAYRLIKITLKHKDFYTLNDASEIMATNLRAGFGNNVLGPESPVINRIQNLYIKNILIKVNKKFSHAKLSAFILKVGKNLSSAEQFKAVRIFYDIDPQ